jgi:sugar (pentulose or hexulose) kinase
MSAGGMSRNNLLLQIQADILNVTVRRMLTRAARNMTCAARNMTRAMTRAARDVQHGATAPHRTRRYR